VIRCKCTDDGTDPESCEDYDLCISQCVDRFCSEMCYSTGRGLIISSRVLIIVMLICQVRAGFLSLENVTITAPVLMCGVKL